MSGLWFDAVTMLIIIMTRLYMTSFQKYVALTLLCLLHHSRGSDFSFQHRRQYGLSSSSKMYAVLSQKSRKIVSMHIEPVTSEFMRSRYTYCSSYLISSLVTVFKFWEIPTYWGLFKTQLVVSTSCRLVDHIPDKRS